MSHLFQKSLIYISPVERSGDHPAYRKVLLRERKRHTAHHVASARYAALSPGGGGPYPIQSWMGGGTPSQVWMGGVTHQVLDEGYPIPDLDWGVPPCYGTPHLNLGWGTPHLNLGWGTPLLAGWMKYTPVSRMGYPPHLDLGWGAPPTSWMGYSPAWTWVGESPHRLHGVSPPRKLNRHTPVRT